MNARAAPEIMLVEDDPGDAGLVRVALRRSPRPCRLLHVRDGAEALAELGRRGPGRPEPLPALMLLDLNLPGQDGHELLGVIRADAHLRALPVVVLSTSGAERDVTRAYGAGANAYVVKPMEMEPFIAAIHAVQEFWFGHARLPAG
jgi:DNA-binding response OmpR family regulator